MHKNYWQRAYQVGLSVYQQRQLANVDEQAGPAYFAAFSLSRWLFWRRLKWAARQIEQTSGQTAIDFGCGFGLLLPHLQAHYRSTIGIDQVPDLALEFFQRWQESEQLGGQLSIVKSLGEVHVQPQSVDLILALDVLEHFQSLEAVVDQLANLMQPSGRLIVSGPTESWFYQVGRRLVGFSGHYHHQTIYDVHTALQRRFKLLTQTSLPPALPLFVMSTWQRHPESPRKPG